MINIIEITEFKQVYNYLMKLDTPYFFNCDYEAFLDSFINDIDAKGRKLFNNLKTLAAYENGKLIGFIQYGKSSFVFTDSGEDYNNYYAIIRNFYFDANNIDVGRSLIKEVLKEFNNENTIYAFFHYFGMSCFARHGKLYEKYNHIENVLKEFKFIVEHENVYYSSILTNNYNSEVELSPKQITLGNQQYIDFKINSTHVGGCEIHYISDEICYLRWIYINDSITNIGIGSKCMNALKNYLYNKGIKRFDTDTALNNVVAQHFYEKNGFINKVITKSYYLK